MLSFRNSGNLRSGGCKKTTTKKQTRLAVCESPYETKREKKGVHLKKVFGSSLIFQQDKHTASPEKVFLRITNTIKCHQSWTGLPLPEPNIREAVWNRLDRKWNKINIQRGALNIVQEAWTPISEDCLKKWQADKELRLSLRINVVIQTIDFYNY